MKQKTYSNSDFNIIVKTDQDFDWKFSLANIETPSTLLFAISTMPEIVIKKITWDFGTGKQIKSFTNRKQVLNGHPFDCKYKKSHNTTITIQASVYTEEDMFIVEPMVSTTVNHILKTHYVNSDDFRDQILKYYTTNNFTDDVADSINKIANRLAFASNFINYTYREEMVGDAILLMVKALTKRKFDPTKGSPFSYFTRIAFNAFCNRIKEEAKNSEELTTYQEEVYGGLMGEATTTHLGDDYSHDTNNYEDQ